MKVPFKIELKDKVAVVTGGGGILCSEFARALAACGAKVAVCDLRLEVAQKVVDEITADGGTAIAVAANVLDKESLEAARKTINEKLGTCDILLNGAGGNNPKGTTTKEYLFPEDLKDAGNAVTFLTLTQRELNLFLISTSSERFCRRRHSRAIWLRRRVAV